MLMHLRLDCSVHIADKRLLHNPKCRQPYQHLRCQHGTNRAKRVQKTARTSLAPSVTHPRGAAEPQPNPQARVPETLPTGYPASARMPISPSAFSPIPLSAQARRDCITQLSSAPRKGQRGSAPTLERRRRTTLKTESSASGPQQHADKRVFGFDAKRARPGGKRPRNHQLCQE